MRLGAYEANIKPGTLAEKLYGETHISERHRHRYEFNPAYREEIERAGLTISATSEGEGLVEIVEIADHPFFIACQFHPEFQSRPNHPHPLFAGLVDAALKAKEDSQAR
jgi:CTP synthase